MLPAKHRLVDNGKALEYLNEVRDSRNLAKLAGPYGNEELMEYLMREMRKDFIGRGGCGLFTRGCTGTSTCVKG
ncbi:MAG: hypothetical protein ACLUPL_08150 [Butyricimonas virosa]